MDVIHYPYVSVSGKLLHTVILQRIIHTRVRQHMYTRLVYLRLPVNHRDILGKVFYYNAVYRVHAMCKPISPPLCRLHCIITYYVLACNRMVILYAVSIVKERWHTMYVCGITVLC
jgi:hypothetical protein